MHELHCRSQEPERACWSALLSHDWDVDAALSSLCPPSASKDLPFSTIYSSGPLLHSPQFVHTEVLGNAPLFTLHSGEWLQRNLPELTARTQSWVSRVGPLYASPLSLVPIPTSELDKDVPRIIWNDCVRTFYGEAHRKRLSTFLHSLWLEMGSYGQAMSYFAGILLLTLEEQEAASLVRRVHKEYIPGHWAAEAVGFATSAYTWEFLLQEVDPELYSHFKEVGFMPETYLQKLFSGLTVHVLDFDLMYDFLEHFVLEGFSFLLRFATALATHLRPQLLKCGTAQIADLYRFMRMDPSVVSRADATCILKKTKEMDLRGPLEQVDNWRMRAYNEFVEPRIMRAPKEETFEPCVICEVERPIWLCEECGTVCNSCHDACMQKGKISSKDQQISHCSTHVVSDW